MTPTDQVGLTLAISGGIAIVVIVGAAIAIRRMQKLFDEVLFPPAPMRFRTVYETFIRNEMLINHMQMVRISADLSDMPVVEFCQNILVRRL